MRRFLVRTMPVAVVAGTLALGLATPAGATANHDVAVFATVMTGAQEAPGPGDPDGIGVFVAVAKGDTVCYVITARKIEPPVAAHIHIAPPGVPGPIVVGLETPVGGFAKDCFTVVPDDQNSTATLTESEFAALKANPAGYYVNVHTPSMLPGAIRGQLH
ncbi:MAG: CHRD domain-containing protein [Sporichthyaceae bacterium]|nr:CHRD domain-containing protein [Sporichthyaceae bacterium]